MEVIVVVVAVALVFEEGMMHADVGDTAGGHSLHFAGAPLPLVLTLALPPPFLPFLPFLPDPAPLPANILSGTLR